VWRSTESLAASWESSVVHVDWIGERHQSVSRAGGGNATRPGLITVRPFPRSRHGRNTKVKAERHVFERLNPRSQTVGLPIWLRIAVLLSWRAYRSTPWARPRRDR